LSSELAMIQDALKRHDRDISDLREDSTSQTRAIDKLWSEIEKLKDATSSLKQSIDGLSSAITKQAETLAPLVRGFEARKKTISWLLINYLKVPVVILGLLAGANFIYDNLLNLPSPQQEKEIEIMKLKQELKMRELLSNPEKIRESISENVDNILVANN